MRVSPIDLYASTVYIRPLEYSVPNDSRTSDSYAESIKRNAGRKNVGATRPVMYADSQVVASAGRQNREKSP